MTPISFVPLTGNDMPLLFQWMQQPHVAQWWGEGISWSLQDIQQKYGSYILGYKIVREEKKSIYPYIINYDGQPIGYLQSYRASDFPSEGFNINKFSSELPQSLAALDFYIGEPDCIGKGIGTEILKAFLKEHLFPHFDACLVDPDKSNKAAIKAYAKAGFTTFYENPSSIIMIAYREVRSAPIVIFGSSRSDGMTMEAIQTVIKDRSVPIIDLRELNISHYDYGYANIHDDFLILAEKMVRHNPIILATPVYWYTMSAMLKTFLDRWSDLLDIRKDLGRRLAGKEMYVIAPYGESIPRAFEEPFSQTCEYLDMQYKGCYYYYSGKDSKLKEQNEPQACAFSAQIFKSFD